MKRLAVSELLSEEISDLKLKLVYGKEFIRDRFISNFRIQKPGLALAGYTDHIHPERVQILGNTEISFVNTLTPEQRLKAFDDFCSKKICCVVVTKNLKIPKELVFCAKKYEVPLFRTELLSSKVITEIMNFLEDKLAPESVIHGVLVDVYGVGVVILGRSGIGKSECALELVKRGHRLVADDAIHIKKRQDILIGTSNDLLTYNIELRGLGILNIKDMFGVSSIRLRKRIEIVISFVDWNNEDDYDRTGLNKNTYEIMGIQLPHLILPVSPGRNMAVIIEAAARNHLLKLMGYDAALEFQDKLMKKMEENRKHEINKMMMNQGVE
ncbi:MAG: HPr(Ser) kinase/phosphatase [Calditerrivibrio sp.]|nr:HPr(Ser) kinase/phosphatase [Calditerrivibrio sp.]